MKTIKLLAALAVPAMFAACTNEEILVESPLMESEIVGAELVGTNISINAGIGDVESRFNGDWELTDMLGLGWTVKTGGTTIQSQTVAPDKPELYANNMFAKEDINGAFVTNGNIYKGWHFAYYPYERMNEIAKKIVVVNPDQESLWAASEGARFDNRFAISARHFLTADDVNPETNQLDSDKKFSVEWANNEIVFHLTPSGNFISSTHLNDLAITKVTLSDKTKTTTAYAATAELLANQVPSVVNANGEDVYATATKDKVVDAAKTKEVLLSKLPTYLVGQYTNSISTNVKVDMNTGVGGSVRIFTLPYVTSKKAISAIDINPTIRVDVEGGYFTIAKVTNAVEGSLDEANNEQLDALIEAYATEGKFTTAEGIGRTQQVTLHLQEKNFKPDFSSISDYKEWQKCVNIVNALGFTTAQTFTIDADIEVSGTTIALPKNCKVIVKAKNNKKLLINKTLRSFPAADKMDVSAIDVVFNANNNVSQQITAKSITNNAIMTITEGTAVVKNTLVGTITNNGTIVINKYAKVEGVDNTDGRIEIIYGGIAETTEPGVIFYSVKGNEPAYQINNLMTVGNVNTFVVNSGIKFDLNRVDINGANQDEYISSPETPESLDETKLTNVKIELAGGEVIGLKNDAQSTVKVIETLAEETNKITDLKAGNIIVKAGILTMDASTKPVGNALIKRELDMKAATIVEVKAGATLIANANTHVASLINAGLVKANAGYLFHYTTGTNSGTLTGDVEVCDCIPPVVAPDFAELEGNVKAAWDLFKDVVGDITTAVTTIQSFSGDIETSDYNSAKFYRALKAWYDAKGISFPEHDTFTADYITTFNLLNEGDTNDIN